MKTLYLLHFSLYPSSVPTTYSHISGNKTRSVILIVLFAAFVVFLGWLFGQLTEAGPMGIILALGLALLMTLAGYFSGDQIALWSAGARPITKEQNPYLYRIVENLAITAGLPVPKIFVIEDPALNAFATGRDPTHASIAVTTGLVEKLENEELEGVLAHELSHIGNYDIRFLMLVAVLVGTVSILANLFLRFRWFGGGRRDRGQAGGILLLLGLLFAILSPLIAQLIQLAVSRKRELLADASGALLTRYPEGLAKALEKIGASPRLARADRSTAHLYISNPFGAVGRGFAGLFSTHPPIEQRIRALREMGH